MSPIDYEKIKEAFIAATFGIGAEIQANSSDLLYETDVFYAPIKTSLPSDAQAAPSEASYQRLRLPDLLDRAKQKPTLGAYIRNKAFQGDMVTYRPASFEQGQISRDYWSKLLNDEIKPSKEKLLRVAVLLQLGSDELEEMLTKAGYALSPTDLRDVVVSYCLSEGHYDFVVIEQLLADHDIQSLFNDRRCS
jgi:hypothetical protein